MITLAMKQFNVDNSQQVLKAGDSGIDIEEGKNADPCRQIRTVKLGRF
ncbi:hypothetical protein [Psychrobacter sp.]